MRYALIMVVILNLARAIGRAIDTYYDTLEPKSEFIAVGAAFDAATIPLSIAIIATAVLRIYPIKSR